MDFVHDQLASRRKLRVLTIVDTFSRFSAALEPRFIFRRANVMDVLGRVGRKMDSRQRSGSTKVPSLYHAIWICRPISVVFCSISPGRESPPTMHSLRRSTDASGRNV